jgi:hypothetical protein
LAVPKPWFWYFSNSFWAHPVEKVESIDRNLELPFMH